MAAVRQRHHMDRPAPAAQQRRLDHVVTHDVAAEGRPAGQARQAAAFREGLDAHDGVMAPEGRFGAGPPVQAGAGDRAIEARRELLPARERRARIDQRRNGLDKAEAGLAIHQRGEPRHGAAAHQAVGVQHDHIIVAAAEARHPILDIARLAGMVDRPAAIIDRHRAGGAQAQEGGTLARLILLRRIAQHEEVEQVARADAVDRADHLAQPAEDRVDILVIDGQQHRRAAARQAQRPQPGRGARPAADQHQKARHGADEAERDPGEQREGQGEDGGVEQVDAIAHEGLPKLAKGQQAAEQRGQQDQGPPVPHAVRLRGDGPLDHRRLAHRLHRHVDGRFGRKVVTSRRESARRWKRRSVQLSSFTKMYRMPRHCPGSPPVRGGARNDY